MSINISLSSKSTGLCDEIIYRFMKADIDAKFIKTTSVSVKNIEYGCDIIISKSREKHVPYILSVIDTVKDKSCSTILNKS